MGQTCSNRRRTLAGRNWFTAPGTQPKQRLPDELVAAIIAMVGDLDTLRTLALVCHNWLPLCLPHIHATVIIDEWGGPGVMPKEEFLRIYSEYPHLSEYVLDVSFKLTRSTITHPFHPYLLSFSKLRSLYLECHPDEYNSRCGILSPSLVSLIPRLVVSSALTRLSIVGFTIPTILDLLRSDNTLSTSLRSLALLQVPRPEWEPSAMTRNPHPIYMVGLHELEIDHNPSFDMFAIETPSLRSLSVLYTVGNLIPWKCPFNITKLTIKLSPNPSWTSSIAFELRRLIRLETLTLQAQNWGIAKYTEYFPWFCTCIRQLSDFCQLQRLEIRLRDYSSFHTLSASDFSSLDDLFSQMYHGRSLREVDLELTGIERGTLMLTLPPPQPDITYIKNETIAGFPCFTEGGILRVFVTIEKEPHHWSKYGLED